MVCAHSRNAITAIRQLQYLYTYSISPDPFSCHQNKSIQHLAPIVSSNTTKSQIHIYQSKPSKVNMSAWWKGTPSLGGGYGSAPKSGGTNSGSSSGPGSGQGSKSGSSRNTNSGSGVSGSRESSSDRQPTHKGKDRA